MPKMSLVVPGAVVVGGVLLYRARPIGKGRSEALPFSTQGASQALELTTALEPPSWLEFSALLLEKVSEAAGTRLANLLRLRQVPRPLRVGDGALVVPDTPRAGMARALAQELSEPWLFEHCMRTFLFGSAFAQQVNIAFDPEVLFIAAMLHDLAWTEAHRDKNVPFELVGARLARAFAVKHNLDKHQADCIHEMIALHTSPGRLAALDDEIGLVSAGAGVDVAGFYIEDLHPETVQGIVQAHPRIQLKKHVAEVLKWECKHKPQSNFARQCSMGFSFAVQLAPFSE